MRTKVSHAKALTIAVVALGLQVVGSSTILQLQALAAAGGPGQAACVGGGYVAIPADNNVDAACKAQYGPSSGAAVTTLATSVICNDKTAASYNTATGDAATACKNNGGYTSKDTNCPTVITHGLLVDCNAKGGVLLDLINFVINWLIGILGGFAVLALIVSGIQYITSQGSPDGIKKAKVRITNAVVGVLLLSIMFIVLKFIGIG